MRKICLVLTWISAFGIPASSQKILQLRNGTLRLSNNVNDAVVNLYNSSVKKTDGKSWLLLHFTAPPTLPNRKNLQRAGIELLQFIPPQTYVVSARSLSTKMLRASGVYSIVELRPEDKIDARLLAIDSSTPMELLIAVFEDASIETASALLLQQGFTITNTDQQIHNVLQVSVPGNKIHQLASLPFVQSIEPTSFPYIESNAESLGITKGNILQSTIPGGYGLTGEGVTVGIGEVAPLFPHVDFEDRLLDVSYLSTINNYHSTHVHGIVGGAGLRYEPTRGYAPKAKLLTVASSQTMSVANSANVHQMVISNNSYATSLVCTRQPYSINAFTTDRQGILTDYMQHVFGAGNAGTVQCIDYPLGFSTISGDYHNSKSVLTIGNIFSTGVLAPGSSKGPATDGRIKPELVAVGSNILSTTPNNAYNYNSGTSMSAPAVAGGLALLYQRYRQLHNGNNPKNSLMKAILCNTASDLGSPGPDYSYGFGCMNLLRAVKAIDNTTYLFDSVTNLAAKTHSISVPAGMAQVKLLLYWQDPPASTLAPRALVHDLDLQTTTPAGSIVLPYILDTLPSLVTTAAKRGEDHINNIEQIVIDNPAAGNYGVRVRGASIGQTVQQSYVLVYDFVPDDVQLTFPFGGESIPPGEAVTIKWEAAGHATSTFKLEFSADGISWQTLNADVAADKRQFDWSIPAIATDKARIRIVRNEDGKASTSASFLILAEPILGLSPVQCPEHIAIEWLPVPGATDYELMIVKNGEMVAVATTSGTKYIFRNLSADSTYWVTVRPRINGTPGRRAIALSRKPDTGSCTGDMSDNDLRPSALLSPLFGRMHTLKTLTANEAISVSVKNLDDLMVSGFTISYSLGNGPWITEPSTLAISALGETSFTFSTPLDLSAPGHHRLRIVVDRAGDTNKANDTLTAIIRHVENAPVDISNPPMEGFENTPLAVYPKSMGALIGAEHFDFEHETGPGTLAVLSRGTPAPNLQFAQLRSLGSPVTQSLISTYNLSAYDTTSTEVALRFIYTKANSDALHDTLFIRGTDTAPWIPVRALDPGPGIYFNDRPVIIELSDYLLPAKQNFSASFQVKWSQETSETIYLLDSIVLQDVTRDIDLLSIDSLKAKNCNLTSSEAIRLTIRNRSRFAKMDVPVKYRINNGPIISETVSIPAHTTIPYTFTAKADLSAKAIYTIEAWAELNGDTYQPNDQKTIIIRNQPIITTMPFLENFENGPGNWYSEGTNNTWQWGTPTTEKIIGAASGTKAWKTNLTGAYNNNETSYVYSPCIDLSGLTRPMISISVAINTDSCILCDFSTVQYSTNGVDWRTMINSLSAGFNWTNVFRSGSYNRWHVASIPIGNVTGVTQFRLLFRSDNAITADGIAIDDFHIYDSTVAIYDENSDSQPVTHTITGGTQWIDFKDNGKLIASIRPDGQYAGVTTVQSFLRPGAPNFHGQYYLRRNVAIQSTNKLTDSLTVRLYYLDREVDSLLFALNCPSCIKPLNAYRFGISQYSSTKQEEINGSILDNIKGNWKFINTSSLKIVPYQKGYYIEFRTKDLSEFWLNKGGFNNNSFLPVDISSFTVARTSATATDLEWVTASEINITRFETEVAKGNDAFAQDLYTKLGETASTGASGTPTTYRFTDESAGKNGAWYYRIKAIDPFGNYSYSKVQSVIYNSDFDWSIAPNHSTGLYQLVFQADGSDDILLEIVNSSGSLVRKEQFRGNGFIDKHLIDLSSPSYASGVYIVKASYKNDRFVFKIVKQ